MRGPQEPSGAPAAAAPRYAEYRATLVAATAAPACLVVSAATAGYTAIQWFVRPVQVQAMLPVYVLLVVMPLLAWYLIRRSIPQHAELVALGFDLTYTACLCAQLFAPESNSSGTVVFLCLKMLTTAVVFPWNARLQYFSASVTLLLYYLSLFLSHRLQNEVLYLFHYFGPPEAALLSMVGAGYADRARADLFRQGAEREELVARQQLILDHMPIGCVMTDAQFRSTYWNPAAEAIFRYRADEVLGKPLHDVIGPTAAPETLQALVRRLQGGDVPGPSRSEHVTQDGRRIVCEWVRTALRQRDGTCVGILSMCQDVTVQQRDEEEKRLLLQELTAANRLKSDFVATMSHELRTPLNIILGYQSLLQEGTFGSLTGEQSAALERIGRSGQELFELISATLDVSRIESGSVAIDRQPVHLHDIAREVELETREFQIKPGVEVHWRVAASLPPVYTDAAKFKVILKNLFSNALKFTDAGSVVVSAAVQNGGVEVQVEDTGIGIPRDALPIIFEPFRQVGDALTRSHGGVGLGLYIVHRLVGMLEATLHVESEPGRGTRFRVWVPRAPE